MKLFVAREDTDPFWYHIGSERTAWDGYNFGDYDGNGHGYCAAQFEKVTGIELNPGQVALVEFQVTIL